MHPFFGIAAAIAMVAFVIIPLGFGTKSGTRYAHDEKQDSWLTEAAFSVAMINPINAVRDWWQGYDTLSDLFIRLMSALVFIGVGSSVGIILWVTFFR